MKHIVFVHGGDVLKREYPVNPKNVAAYELLFSMGRERGFKMVWSSLKYFDEHKKSFVAYTWFNGTEWRKVTSSIKPDFIFNKALFNFERIPLQYAMAAAAPLLNPVEMQIIASDKMLTYLTFPEIVYPMKRVNTNHDIQEALKAIKTKRIVLKPISGAGGNGVHIISRKAARNFKVTEPYVIQEFIDASRGIPGIYKGVHDFRLLFLHNKLFHAFYRTQAPGTLMCNVTQGADRVVVPLSKVPKIMLDLARTVQQRLKMYENTFYSLDFIFNKNGKPKVIEMNTTSGLDNAPGYDKSLRFVYKKLLDHIEKFV